MITEHEHLSGQCMHNSFALVENSPALVLLIGSLNLVTQGFDSHQNLNRIDKRGRWLMVMTVLV